MTRICPKCGTENGAASVHCRVCRGKLPEPAAGIMMRPSPSSRWKSFLRSTFWVFVLLAIGAAGFWTKENVDWSDVRSVAVNLQHYQSDVSSAMRRWYSKWLSAEPAPPPTPVPAPAPVPENAVNIRCPRCGGVGYTGDGTYKTTCLLCNQIGGHKMILPAGADVCGTCQGMGQIVRVVHGKEVRMQCRMCSGNGYIIRKY
ncbi:MAG: hypothetical protein PHW60_07395 [Kiritimatiellae bacterium]|nr:hypothetical protein [Kiritimatiellia bacterium]